MIDKLTTACITKLRRRFASGESFDLDTIYALAESLVQTGKHPRVPKINPSLRCAMQREITRGLAERVRRGWYRYLHAKQQETSMGNAVRSSPRAGVFQGLFQKSLQTEAAVRKTEAAVGDESVSVIEDRFSEETLALDDLKIDERYQYVPENEPGRVAKLTLWMAERGGFDPAERGRIHVNRRADGSLYTMDGGGGSWMARKAGRTHIDSFVADKWTWQQEAKFFLDKNMRHRTVKKPHLFYVAAMAGLEPHATIYRLLIETGYRLERTKGTKGAIIAITSLLFVWQLDGTGDILHKSLLDMRHTLGDQDQVDGRFLVAIGVIRAMHPTIKTDGLRKVLMFDVFQKHKKNQPLPLLIPSTLLAIARQTAAVKLSSRPPQPRDTNPPLAQEILRRYNYGREDTERKKDRLEWIIERVRSRFTDKEQSKDVWTW